jgi:hypothetical protein
MFLGLLHTPSDMDMSSSAGMSDCPFTAHDNVICGMSFTNHISVWKTTFLSVLPTLTLLLIAAGTAILIVFFNPRLKYSTLRSFIYIKEYTYTFTYRPLQDLFSQGILHPKLF